MAISYFAQRAPKLRYFGDIIHSFLLKFSRRTRWWCLKCLIMYLARDIRPFVMYCVNGKLRSSLLIESTDSMIPGACQCMVETHTPAVGVGAARVGQVVVVGRRHARQQAEYGDHLAANILRKPAHADDGFRTHG